MMKRIRKIRCRSHEVRVSRRWRTISALSDMRGFLTITPEELIRYAAPARCEPDQAVIMIMKPTLAEKKPTAWDRKTWDSDMISFNPNRPISKRTFRDTDLSRMTYPDDIETLRDAITSSGDYLVLDFTYKNDIYWTIAEMQFSIPVPISLYLENLKATASSLCERLLSIDPEWKKPINHPAKLGRVVLMIPKNIQGGVKARIEMAGDIAFLGMKFGSETVSVYDIVATNKENASQLLFLKREFDKIGWECKISDACEEAIMIKCL